MADLLEQARAEATLEVARSILTSAGDAMARHGNDPHGGSIIAAGFAEALRLIGENIDGTVPLVVLEMLKARTR